MADQEGKKPVRLDRLLAQEGFGTRSELKKQIRAGRAFVNGRAERDPGRQVFPEDRVVFDGKEAGQERYVYYMLNKPAGVITATEDGRDRTVLDILRDGGVLRRGLFPVGRLDRDTEGLLLITDDGELAHRLLSPKRHVDKTYFALVTGAVSQEEIRLFEDGLYVDEELTAMPAKLRALPAQEVPGWMAKGAAEEAEGVTAGTAAGAAPAASPAVSNAVGTAGVLVTIQEGKYHQIKRMFRAVGKEVLYLRRVSMGPLRLDETLSPGEFRELTEEERSLLFTDARAGGSSSEC